MIPMETRFGLYSLSCGWVFFYYILNKNCQVGNFTISFTVTLALKENLGSGLSHVGGAEKHCIIFAWPYNVLQLLP